MFKYASPRKTGSPAPAPAPAPNSYDETGVPSDWSTPAGQAADDSAPAPQGGYFGGAETSAAPFEGVEAIPGAASSRNILNSDVSVVGILRFTDDLLVDGSVEGEITSDGVLTVGANARIQAGEKNKVAVRTKSAIIQGKVAGDIEVTDRVELTSTAELVGDVTASKISIQEGAIFIGHCRVGASESMPVPVAPKKGKTTKAHANDNLLG